jgi:predicted nucleic acid-binding protein
LKLFVDTWGWLALADRSEVHHKWAAKFYAERSRRTGRILTSSFVLDEFLSLLFARRSFAEASRFAKALLASPFVTVEHVTRERFDAAFELRLRFSDKPKISFTDLTSMVIMKEFGIVDVMTADSHFLQVGLGFHTFPE